MFGRKVTGGHRSKAVLRRLLEKRRRRDKADRLLTTGSKEKRVTRGNWSFSFLGTEGPAISQGGKAAKAQKAFSIRKMRGRLLFALQRTRRQKGSKSGFPPRNTIKPTSRVLTRRREPRQGAREGRQPPLHRAGRKKRVKPQEGLNNTRSSPAAARCARGMGKGRRNNQITLNLGKNWSD